MLLTALLAADPQGTVTLELKVGQIEPVKATPGSSIICDDPSVVTPEFSADGSGYVLHALKPGTTLCGVWGAEQVPGGLYRVRVAPKPK